MLGEFKDLPINTKLYTPETTHVELYYFYGMHPKAARSIMLGSSYNILTVKSHTVNEQGILKQFYTDYNEAKQALIEQAEDNLKQIKEVYLTEI